MSEKFKSDDGGWEVSARRMRLGGAWAIVGKAIIVLLGFLVSALLARLLSPADMGEYFLAFSVVTAGTVIGQMGLDRSVIRLVSSSMAVGDFARCKRGIQSVLQLGGAAAVFVAIFFSQIFGEWIFIGLLNSEQLLDSLHWLSIWIVILVFEKLISDIFRGFHDIRLAVCFSGLIRSGILAFLFYALWSSNLDTHIPLKSVLIYSLVAGGISALIGFVLLQFKIKSFQLSSDSVYMELIEASWPVMVHAILLYLVYQSNLWILGAFSTKEDVAMYGAAMRLVLLVGISSSIVTTVVPPLIAEQYARGSLRSIEALMRAATFICGVPSIAILILYLFQAEWVLGIVFGGFYQSASLVLVILSVGELVKVLTGPCSMVLNMTGHQVILMRLSIFRTVFSVLLSLLVVKEYGAFGIAVAYVIGLVANDIICFILTKRYLGIWTHMGFSGFGQLFSRMAKPNI